MTKTYKEMTREQFIDTTDEIFQYIDEELKDTGLVEKDLNVIFKIIDVYGNDHFFKMNYFDNEDDMFSKYDVSEIELVSVGSCTGSYDTYLISPLGNAVHRISHDDSEEVGESKGETFINETDNSGEWSWDLFPCYRTVPGISKLDYNTLTKELKLND